MQHKAVFYIQSIPELYEQVIPLLQLCTIPMHLIFAPNVEIPLGTRKALSDFSSIRVTQLEAIPEETHEKLMGRLARLTPRDPPLMLSQP